MVDPAGTARGPRPYLVWLRPLDRRHAGLPDHRHAGDGWRGNVLVPAGPGRRPAPGGPDSHPLAAPLTFEEAVKIALTQSPAFTKSSLEIDIGRMDETDSRYAMVPPLTFRTYYYVNRPSGTGYGKPYSLNFSTEPYNPLGAYFTLQAQKLATQAAILSHIGVISSGLLNLGSCYLQLDALHKQAGIQKDLIKVAQENLTYAENRVAIGTGTSLEVKMAQQQLQLARGEQEGIALAEKRTLIRPEESPGVAIQPGYHPGFL